MMLLFSRNEVVQTTNVYNFAGMWHIHALATVMRVKVKSVYPEYGGFTVRPMQDRICKPRDMDTGN